MGFRYGLGWLVSLFLEMNEDFQLGALNSRPELDNTTFLNQFIIDEENDFNIFNDTQINSLYFNIETFSTKCRSENKPVVISLNILSLQSKLNELVTLLTCLSSKNIFIDVIALQEIWAVPYHEAVSIPGYHNIITNCRKIYRGGGVGFYLRDYIEFEKLQNMSPFREKLFESLSIKVKLGKNLLSQMYTDLLTPHQTFLTLMP